MSSTKQQPDRASDSLSVKLGGWFEAHATGRGVVAVPIVVLVVVIVLAATKLWGR
jgi:hypothetical protein